LDGNDETYSKDVTNDDSQGSFWNSFVNVASNLTVNVGKAWATNVSAQDGEVTPAGQESRLTRAMKAYHLEKAKDPSELPEWLFNEVERGVKSSKRGRNIKEETRDDEPREITEEPPIAKSGGLRAIYASAAATDVQQNGRRERMNVNRYGDDTTAPSKAANRLRAMRDAKNGRGIGASEAMNVNVNEGSRVASHNSHDHDDGDRQPRVKVEINRRPMIGLPSGPRRR